MKPNRTPWCSTTPPTCRPSSPAKPCANYAAPPWPPSLRPSLDPSVGPTRPGGHMHTPPEFTSLEGAYMALLRLATEESEHHIAARGNEAREVIGVGFRLTDPRQ